MPSAQSQADHPQLYPSLRSTLRTLPLDQNCTLDHFISAQCHFLLPRSDPLFKHNPAFTSACKPTLPAPAPRCLLLAGHSDMGVTAVGSLAYNLGINFVTSREGPSDSRATHRSSASKVPGRSLAELAHFTGHETEAQRQGELSQVTQNTVPKNSNLN